MEDQLPFAVGLLQDCLHIDEEMQMIILESEIIAGGLTHWPAASSSLGMLNDIFSESYTFPNIGTAVTMMISWAALTVFWSGLCQLYYLVGCLTILAPTEDGRFSGHYTIDGVEHYISLPLPGRFADFPTMARNVCRSVEFCLSNEVGMTILTPPLTMVIEGLGSWPGQENEVARARGLLEWIKGSGVSIVPHSRSLHKSASEWVSPVGSIMV